MNRSQANILLVLVALIWGSAFVAQARGMDGVGPFTFTGLRFLLGVCVVAPFAWRDWRKLQAREVRPGKPELYGVVGLGALLALGAVFQQIGMLYTTVTNAGFLTALYVPLVPLLSWGLLRLRPHWSTWPTALGCLFGTWLLSGANGLNVGVGDAWVILSSLFWGLHVLYVGHIAERVGGPFLVAWGQFLVVGVVCTAWAIGYETITLDGLREALIPILYTGIISVGFAYTGQVVAQRYAGAADAAIILSSETLFAALFGYLLMGDRLNALGVAGCVLIFVCIIAVQLAPLIGARIQADGARS